MSLIARAPCEPPNTNRRGARELAALLEIATRWYERSGGAFDPSVGRLTRCWAEAAHAGEVPTDRELAALVRELAR